MSRVEKSICELTAKASQYVGLTIVVLYLIIGTMLMRSQDPRLFVSLLAIAPVSMLLVRVPAIWTLLKANLGSVSTYIVITSTLGNFVLGAVYATHPCHAIAICIINMLGVLWFMMRTDRFDEQRLYKQCEAGNLF